MAVSENSGNRQRRGMGRPSPGRAPRRGTRSGRVARAWGNGLPFAAAAAFSALFIYLGVTNGELRMSLADVLRTLLRASGNPDFELAVFQFRLPRIVLGALVGFALGFAGSAVQTLTRNPLADPGILGIHSGAGLFTVLFMVALPGGAALQGAAAVLAMPVFSMIGGLLSTALLYLLAQSKGSFDPGRFVLVGIAVGSGFGAGTLYLSLKMNPQDFERAAMWLSGNLNSANWLYAAAVLPWVLILAPYLWIRSRAMDLLRLNDSSLISLGVPLRRTRNGLLAASVGLTAAGVSVAGSIAFVGLIAPHLAYRLTGQANRRALPLSGLIGMGLVLAGDFIGRTVFSPAQLPVGVAISILGAPYFAYLLIRQQAPRNRGY